MNKKTVTPLIALSIVLSMSACSNVASSLDEVSSKSNDSNLNSDSIDQSTTSSIDFSSNDNNVSSSNSDTNSSNQTCFIHDFGEETTREASIIQRGAKVRVCKVCGYQEEKDFTYDVNELDFIDKTFLYDGQERELLIEGMIPYGCTVKYTNNKRIELGEQTAVAKIYDPDGHMISNKSATLKIVENTGLPNLRITTGTGQDPNYKDKTNYTSLTNFSIDNCDSKYAVSGLTGGIRARGNSTNYDDVSKRPWRLKFDSKVNLLGLNNGQKFKSWVVLADYFDQSMFRNMTAFNLGNSLFNYSNNYCSSYQHVNLYMNGDYRGVYLLAEQQQVNPGRIEVNEPGETNLDEKVGYLVEIDIRADDPDDYYFTCGPKSQRSAWGTWSGGTMINGVRVVSSTYAIKSDTFDEKQNKYIEKYIANAMDALISLVKGEKLQVIDENNTLVDSPFTTQYETLNSFIDLDSVFKICILHELMKNYDVGFGSFYIYIDFTSSSKYPRLTFGAPWDFDLSSGNKQSGDIIKTNNEFIKAGFGEANFNPWLYLFSQTDFYDELIRKYYSVFDNSQIFDNAVNLIKYEASAFKSAFDNNVERWKNGTAKTRMQNRSYSNHADAVTYLVNWLNNRKAYMDSVYLK